MRKMYVNYQLSLNYDWYHLCDQEMVCDHVKMVVYCMVNGESEWVFSLPYCMFG